MTVQELIDQLTKVGDKTQRVHFFDNEAKIDEKDLYSLNHVEEARYEGEDIVIIEWNENL